MKIEDLRLKIEMNKAVQKWAGISLRLVFGGILIAASIDKILHPVQFSQAVENYQLAGETLSRWAAVWLPYLEIITGILLILGIWVKAAAILNLGMMFIFFVAVFQAYVRGLDIHCGCFTVEGDETVDLWKILYNLLLAIGSGLLLMVYRRSGRAIES
ncbi:MAG: DoxX family membrane protein [Calditrichaceae bacterium]|nr:DoxX family membrane protein [Calditrichia bacterium]NUQ41738.1 DoxX family membrane protein [Calditrichaceae bacterium]